MSLVRLQVLIVKEAKQLLRDPFSFLLGIMLPVVMLLICGFGMSTDIRNIKLAIVVPEASRCATLLVDRFNSSEYFDVLVAHSWREGENLVRSHRADACLFLPQELTKKFHSGGLQILIVTNATNPS
ncbi:MAG: hypothetical protein PHQ75_14465, partial [Thermoguttaceae bacterium]|nr:hypothetical protein [Thermoguttaceae bacterium]